jgi:DNA end-binding protein Ku
MKKIWSGSLSFSLVTIPVNLYTAVKEHVFGFTLLCSKCHTPIEYKRFCPHCKKDITWNNVVKGLKQPDGNYFVITPEKLKALKPEKIDEIVIHEFVPLDAIELIYLEHHYYLAPAKDGQSSYNLFCTALADTKKAAIATLVMRDKEYVCAISPHEKGLLLTTLNYAYEIVPSKEIFQSKAKKPSASELKLAKQLITQNSSKKFDISPFKDSFIEKLKKAIKTSKRVRPSKKGVRKERKSHAESLTSALKASIAHRKPVTHERSIHVKKSKQSSRKKR